MPAPKVDPVRGYHCMARSLADLSLDEIREKYSDPTAVVSSQLLRKLQRDPRTGAQKLFRTLGKRAEEQRRERLRLEAMLHFERLLWKQGIVHIAGVDEVGMGPLAGPVVAAAVVFPPHVEIQGIDDSKALDHETRVRLDVEIRKHAAAVGMGIVEVEEIDRLNIYHAGLRAMQIALAQLSIVPQHVLVDSRTIPGVAQPQSSFDKGDGINFSIASASIIAKVHRDALMTQLDASYPGYGFASHKGYATAEHQNAIRELGPCPIHRKSFDFIREIRGEYCGLYYDLKARGGRVASRQEMMDWEAELKTCCERLSEMENKKLQLLKGRVWRRLGA
jgi:ribonuclease HII